MTLYQTIKTLFFVYSYMLMGIGCSYTVMGRNVPASDVFHVIFFWPFYVGRMLAPVISATF